MRLGGFKVDLGSVLAWLGLICARCAAGLVVAFGLLQGCGYASFGLGFVMRCPKPPILALTSPKMTVPVASTFASRSLGLHPKTAPVCNISPSQVS